MKMQWFGTAARAVAIKWVLNTQKVIDPFRFVLIAVSGWMKPTPTAGH
jgi:hypothetical protein